MGYLILGGGGQLAQAFGRHLGDQARVLGRSDLDITDAAALEHALSSQQPHVVINCAAYNWVDGAEEDADAAWAVNAHAVGILAELCRRQDRRLVHFSTNYVFGVERERRLSYREEDAPGPINVYGKSKLAGERLALTNHAGSLVIRTCGLFGEVATGSEPRNFVARVLRLARQGERLRVVNDQVCTPTRTDDVARATVGLLGVNAQGLFHLTSDGACTWFEFTRAVLEEAGVVGDLQAVSSAELGARAERPAFSVLSCERYSTWTGDKLPHWREALTRYLDSF